VANKCPTCHYDNPETVKFCGECGTQLPPPYDPPPVMTETLQTPVRELTTGSTFSGRYQVIEELGHGGMGRVYKVFDIDIKEKIALKLLRPEMALDKETVERFSNELKLARKISHRNVCRMFDMGKAEGTTFITMEFVPGEDLKKFIRKSGQLGAGRAVSIGKQICEGLAEAHHLGVVHRDLKPQNIMVDEDGNARIMDFGIARSVSGKSITGAGVMIGTPEYMSPEQVEGRDIDQRSDIYSLGVILYEMVTGRVPFEGDTPLSVAVKQKTEAPRDPRTINPQVPEDLNRAILRCLEKEKEKRYQTAEEILIDLDKIEKVVPTAEKILPKKERLTSREITVMFTAKKLMAPAVAFLALIVAGIILWRILPSKKAALPSSASGQPTLTVLYFENKSGDPKLDNWRDGLTELLIEALNQSRYVRVVSSDQLYTILKRLGLADARKYSSEDIEKIVDQTRATHVLRGSYIKAGESFVITAELQKPGTGESATALRLEARDEKEIIPKIDELTRQVKEGLNLTATQIAADFEKEAGRITTSSPEALKYYVEGRRLHNKGEFGQSIAHMEKAVELDPEFALAYRSMGMAHLSLGHDVEGRKDYKKALELSVNLPENERLIIESNVFMNDENYAKAREVLERLLKIYPGHLLANFWLARIFEAAGDFDGAIDKMEFVVQNEKSAVGVCNLARFYMEKGRCQKAEDLCRSFLQDVEDEEGVRSFLSFSYLFRRQFDLALGEAEKAFLLKPDSKELIGNILFLKGDIAGAEKVYRQVSEKDRAGGRGCLYRLAVIHGKYNEALALTQQNLEELKGKKDSEAGAYGWLAGALETAGRYQEALRALGQYLKLSAEYRKSAGESGLPYLPTQQMSDLFAMGRIQTEMKSFAEAERTAGELEALVDKGVNKKELRWPEYILGLIEFGKKNYIQAANLFERACSRLDYESDWSPDHAPFFNALARALYESGELDKARQEYEKITLLTTGRLDHGDIYAKSFYMLGKIAEQQEDKARAITNYQKFLDLWKDADPGLPEPADARKRLASL
jgi:serine/threonine protein kinase/tetratricopeptide (TPR) repeat protein